MKTATAALENNIGSGWWAKRQQQMVAKVLAPLSHAKRGVLRLTLPNGNSIEFGEHPCDHFNPVIVAKSRAPSKSGDINAMPIANEAADAIFPITTT